MWLESRWVIALGVWAAAACSSRTDPGDGASVERDRASEVGPIELSDEFAFAPVTYVPRVVECPRAAFGRSSYLVVHSLRYDDYDWRHELAGTRLDRDGHVLDRFAIPIAAGDNVDPCAPVVFTGASWLTVWSAHGNLWCARMSEDGTVLDPGGVDTGVPATSVNDAAFDGSRTLVVSRPGHVTLIENDCRQGAPRAELTRTSGAEIGLQNLAFDGRHYWVAYTEKLVGSTDKLWLQDVSTTGIPAGSRLLAMESRRTRQSSDSINQTFLGGRVGSALGKSILVYGHAGRPMQDAAGFRTLSESGVFGAAQPLVVSSSQYESLPSAITTVGEGVVVGTSAPGTSLAKLEIDGSSVLSVLAEPQFSLASDGTNVLIPYLEQDYSVPRSQSLARLRDAQLQPLSAPAPLREGAADQSGVQVVSNAGVALVLWSDAARILGTRFSDSGGVVDSEPLVICAPDNWGSSPALITATVSGSDFLVTCREGSVPNPRWWGRVVPRSGALDTQKFSLPDYTQANSIGSDGSRYVSLSHDTRYDPSAGGAEHQIHATLLSTSGVPLDGSRILLRVAPPDSYGYSWTGAVVDTGTDFLVATSFKPFYSDPLPTELHRLARDGRVVSVTSTNWIGPIDQLLWNGEQGLVLFRDATQTRLQAGRVTASGSPLDAQALALSETAAQFAEDTRPSAAWDGSHYWVTWKDARRVPLASDDLFVARVGADGSVLDPGGRELTRAVVDPLRSGPGGAYGRAGGALGVVGQRILAVYTRFEPQRELESFMLHARWLDTGAAGGAGGAGGEGAGQSSGGSGGEAGESTGSAGETAGGAAGETANHGGESTSAGGGAGEAANHGGESTSAGGGAGEAANHGGESTSAGGAGRGGSAAGGRASEGGAAGQSAGSAGRGSQTGGRGGAPPSSSGAHSAGNGGATPAPPNEGDPGCACRTPGPPAPASGGFAWFLALALGALRLSRTPPRRSCSI
jgi:MYXO-CTERM domain-containing protein